VGLFHNESENTAEDYTSSRKSNMEASFFQENVVTHKKRGINVREH
jgi:hypothetical protein